MARGLIQLQAERDAATWEMLARDNMASVRRSRQIALISLASTVLVLASVMSMYMGMLG